MDWELLGFKHYPFSVNPISMKTIELFTGHDKEIQLCKNTLVNNNMRLIIEGARGVGTTSFANYLKFSEQAKKMYLAPRIEVSVEAYWNLESLLTAVISSVVREMEITDSKINKNKVFTNAKALSYRLSEAYNNFGIMAFSVGASYGKSGSVSQPSFIPSTTLGHYLHDLGILAVKQGYKNGILIQLNNLDLNVVHSEEHLSYLFNAARDFLQIENISWLLVGDVGISSFTARRVDRLDDIISDRIFIKPLDKINYHKLLNKRIEYYRLNKKSEFPLNQDVFDYLYDITGGRLRYIFGLVHSLFNRLQIGRLVQRVSLDLAKETITTLAQERMDQFSLSNAELDVIRYLVNRSEANVVTIVKETRKNRTFISKIMNDLLEKKCVLVRKEGQQRIYSPSLDARIAFSTK
jgi:Penicillinase repressor